jgi:hypothetical protein
LEKPVFSDAFYRELAAENPFGLTVTRQEAEAWFHYIAWPAYKTYHYKRHQIAVRRWWARCTMKDLDRAREAMENRKFEQAQNQQDDLDSGSDNSLSPDNDTSLRKILGGKRD